MEWGHQLPLPILAILALAPGFNSLRWPGFTLVTIAVPGLALGSAPTLVLALICFKILAPAPGLTPALAHYPGLIFA